MLLEAIVFLAPAFLLALTFLAGRYPGEDTLVSATASSRMMGRRAIRPTAPLPRLEVCAHGPLLIARALAERAPPAAVHPA